MPGILLKTSEVNGHSHFAYIRPSGAGLTSITGSTDKTQHTHEIVTDVADVPVIDPQTGQPVIDPQTGQPAMQTQSETKLLPALKHTHALVALFYNQTHDNIGKDEDLIKDCLMLASDTFTLEETSRIQGDESKRFIRNDQWKSSDKIALKAKNKTMLTINECKSIRDKLSGIQRQSRTDISFTPTEDGDARVAELLNVLVANIMERNRFIFTETKTFEDQVDVGRGVFNVSIDRSKNLEGDIVVSRTPWNETWFGPHNELDGRDSEYSFRAKWYARDLGIEMFGEEFAKVPLSFNLLANTKEPSRRPVGDQWIDTIFDDKATASKMRGELFNKDKKMYRVLEVKKKVYKRVPVVFNLEDETFLNLGNIAKKDLNEILTIPILFSRDVVRTQVRIVVFSGNVVLAKYYSELGEYLDDIPVYANKDNEYFWGKIEELKDMQREINYRHSQAIEVIRRTVLRNRYYDGDTFGNPVDEKNFLDNANNPGSTFKVNDVNRKPEPETDVRFPGEIVQMEELATTKLKSLSNVDVDSARFGAQGSIVSGSTLREAKKDSIIGNEYLFDNLMLSKSQLARVILKAIQVCYTPERIYRIIDNRFKFGKAVIPLDENGQPKFSMEDVQMLLETADLTQYDVAVDESKHSPTRRNYNFMIWSELARNGVPVPPALLIDLSDLPDKGKYLAMIQAQAAAQAAAEDKKYNTELQKTQIAAGSKESGQSQAEGGGVGTNLIPAR